MGACRADVELDDVSFKSVERPGGIFWLRYIAAAGRGLSMIWMQQLPYRVTAAGQRGGERVLIDEMTDTC